MLPPVPRVAGSPLELSTILREVSQCPEKTPTRSTMLIMLWNRFLIVKVLVRPSNKWKPLVGAFSRHCKGSLTAFKLPHSAARTGSSWLWSNIHKIQPWSWRSSYKMSSDNLNTFGAIRFVHGTYRTDPLSRATCLFFQLTRHEAAMWSQLFFRKISNNIFQRWRRPYLLSVAQSVLMQC